MLSLGFIRNAIDQLASEHVLTYKVAMLVHRTVAQFPFAFQAQPNVMVLEAFHKYDMRCR